MKNTLTTSYGELKRNIPTPTKGTKVNGVKSQRKPTAPRVQVSVEFAADQWFRILLVHLQKQHIQTNPFFVPMAGI